MLFGGQKSRQVWQRITTPKFFARRIGARSSRFRRELHDWCIFLSCSPRDQRRLWRKTGAILRHLLQALRIFHELANVAREQFTGEFRLLEKNCGIRFSIDFCIARLMIFRGVRIWNQNPGNEKPANSARLAAPDRATTRSAAL